MAKVTVKFNNETYNYSTMVNDNCSDDQIQEYFIGTWFNLGISGKDDLQKCIDIVIERTVKV